MTISTCSFAGEYSTINGAVAGQTLQFTSSVATDGITIHSGSANGPVIAFGTTPLTFANGFTGTLYAHWNTAGCGSQNACRMTTVQCTNCPVSPTPTPTPGGTPTPTPTPTPPPPVSSLTEEFADITTLVPGGWVMQNNSQPLGTTGWFQGNSEVFPDQSDAPDSYIAANFNNAGPGEATISNWLLTPPLTLQSGSQLGFWTRTIPNSSFPDRLQVRMSTEGSSSNVGATATDVGDFTTLLLDINPTYTVGGYPESWTQFVVTLPAATPTTGRIGFRYFGENGGPSGHTTTYIGITDLRFTPPAPTPTPTPTPTPLLTPTPTPTETPVVATPTPTATPTPPAGCIVVTATGANLGPTLYLTVKDGFDAINAGTHQGVINVSVVCDTVEPAVGAMLNASGTGSASYTSVLMTPMGPRTVTGAITAGLALIDLNGADNVTINGLNASGNSLTLSNTTVSATAGTSTVRLINGATGDTLTNCNVLGSSTSSTNTAGGNVLISTSAAGANSSNTISNNNIGPAGANLPTKGVTSLGAASPNNNVANTINNNNVFDFFIATTGVAGINIQINNATVTISNNRVYQTAPRTFTAGNLTYTGILVQPGSAGSATITGNTIGFGAANGTGTTTISGSSNRINGINASSVSTTVTTSIQNNRVSGFNQTTSQAATTTTSGFIGISVGATAGSFNVGGTTGNNIGSLDGSSSIVINNTSTTTNTWACLGIFDFSFQNGDVISNNGIGTITINSGGTGTGSGFRGIRNSQTSGVSTTINNNTIGGTAAGSITDNVVGTYNMYGIDNVSANLTCTGNLVRNMVGNANASGFIGLSGIIISTASTGANTISQNTIHSLTLNGGASSTAIYALYGNFPTAANVVERNFVHSLSVNSTNNAAQIAGILGVAGSGTYKNNMVRLGVDSTGAPINAGYTMYGMFDIAGTNNMYFNSVYIGGDAVVSSSNTFAFVSNVVTVAHNYIDNIFDNARSNASGTGKNYAISVAGTAPNPAGLTSNYNDLYAPGVGGFVGSFNAIDQLTLASWQAATSQDANSISADPQYLNPNGTTATVNLHIAATSPCLGIATPIGTVTNDFDNEARDVCPDIGADEITGGVCATPTPTPTPTPIPVSISGTAVYCPNPGNSPVPGVTMTYTGSASGSTSTDGSGNYLISVPSGGSYTVTPTKPALTPGTGNITGTDAVAIQRHFLVLGTPLTGCRLMAADVNGIGGVDGIDAIATQRFFLGFTSGIANVGKYQFTPVSRSYPAVASNQIAQNYDALIFGDVASAFVHRPGRPPQDAPDEGTRTDEVPATVAAVALPEVAVDQSKSNFIAAVTTSAVDPKNKLVGFQGDFTFDERVVSFQSEPVQKAGTTGGNWNVSGNVLPGAGPIRTLRISAYSNDFTPLSGSGALFELRMTRVSKAAQSTQLLWASPPDQFIFIDADLNTQTPGYAASGSVTPSGRRK